jgi:hypothetical protein
MKLFTDKRRLAKEWLYFLGFTVPWAILTIGGGLAFEPTSIQGVGRGTHHVYSIVDILRGLVVILFPYLLFLLIRSTIWAIKTLKSKEKP